MKKKLWLILLATTSMFCLVFGISACDDKSGGYTMHTHSFTNFVYNNDATCTEDGTETEVCTCGAKGGIRTKSGTALGHDIKPLPAKEATCSENGYSAHNGCSRCGYTEETPEYTEALHIKYELNDKGTAYTVEDLDNSCTDQEVAIPKFYKGLPVTSIGNSAFSYCRELTNVTIGNYVTTIGLNAFFECSGLQNVIWNAENCIRGGTYLGSYGTAFINCTNLNSVTFGENVKTIPAYTFSHCSKLTSVTIGANVISIEYAAFEDCSGLKTIYYQGPAVVWENIPIANNNTDLTSATCYYFTEDKPTAEEWAEWDYWWHYDPETNEPTPWIKENQ